MLKLFINSVSMGQQLDDELRIYDRIERGSGNHPGRDAVRSLIDSFNVKGPEDKHLCLVHPPLWESTLTFLHRNPIRTLPTPVLAFVLKRLFLALDYLHTEYIKADDILFGVGDDSVFDGLVKSALRSPDPRTEIDGRTIYLSHELGMPRAWGAPILGDFGSAVPGGIEHVEDVQPNIYRAPEVILDVPWTDSVDIWNVGCMIWDIFEGGSLFSGHDPEFQTYRSRAHLAEMIRLFGPAPSSLIAQGNSPACAFCAENLVGNAIPLEQRKITLEGADRARFLRLVEKMLQWDPAKCSSAEELQENEWICKTLE